MNRAVRGAMAKMLGNHVKVSRVEAPTPGLRRVRLEGRRVQGMSIHPGDKIKLHVGNTAMRSYTPSALDPDAGWMEVLVHVHGESPGSRWASALRPGDDVQFMGPSPSLDGRVPANSPWVLFYGDETAAGLAELIAARRPPGVPMVGALELAEAELPIAAPLSLAGVLRGTEHGRSLLQHLEGLSELRGPGVVFLSGEASSVLLLRTALLERGVPRSQMRIKPYWSVRGKAHRKQLERGALRS